jgi:hypothetical protein
VNLPVEFVIRTTELRKITAQLQANREEHSDSDFMDIVVSDRLATFRSVGTEVVVDADGKHTGSARIPLRIMDKINKKAETFRTEELAFRCEPGCVRIDNFSVKHPDIKVDELAGHTLALPVDLSVLDTLALARILDSGKIVKEGLEPRVRKAREARDRAVANAHSTLQLFGVTDRQLDGLVEVRVKEAAERIRPSLRKA